MSAAVLDELWPRFGMAAAHGSSPVTPRGYSSEQEQNKRRVTRRVILTGVATGDSSMSRCGLMELTYQGARAVGSGVGIPGPISSLESIPRSGGGE